MKLLFDHNLSPKLVLLLAEQYPGSSHVASVAMDKASDSDVWAYARASGFTIVTKDSDFNDLVLMRGFPPKVIWLRLGNCTMRQVADVLRSSYDVVEEFLASVGIGILELN